MFVSGSNQLTSSLPTTLTQSRPVSAPVLVSSAASATPTSRPLQQLGTLWIQNANGSTQMVRVVQATAARNATIGNSIHGNNSVAAATSARVIRAMIRPPVSHLAHASTQPAATASALAGQSLLRHPALRTASKHTASSSSLFVRHPPSARDSDALTVRRVVLQPSVAASDHSGAIYKRALSTAAQQPLDGVQSPCTSAAQKRSRRCDTTTSASTTTPADRCGKGLRHFSTRVCEKVRAKGRTTYNEVADELVAEYSHVPHTCVDTVDGGAITAPRFDQKNVRRRVYDALNVLMAMHIISKERKEIRWLGLPGGVADKLSGTTSAPSSGSSASDSGECERLQRELQQLSERVRAKTQRLRELLIRQVAFKRLVQRNRHTEMSAGGANCQTTASSSVVQLPFIIVNTNKRTVIDCSISSDKTEYLFNFDDTFEIHDDVEVLRRMRLTLGLDDGTCSEQELREAKELVPASLVSYLDHMGSDPLCAPAAVSISADTQHRGGHTAASHVISSDWRPHTDNHVKSEGEGSRATTPLIDVDSEVDEGDGIEGGQENYVIRYCDDEALQNVGEV